MSIPNFSGQTFGQYELREIIGTGGMGTVYRAYQASLRRTVAVKVLPAMLMDDAEFAARFQREAETAAALEHPHIIPVYDYGVEGETSYIVMRLLTGGTLAERLDQYVGTDHPLPSLGEIALLLSQLAKAFDYAHAKGVIHRDIKPSNLMFGNQANPFVVDFGIARLIANLPDLTAPDTVIGTPSYMAPEQWRSERLTEATDQYALGATIYRLIAGEVPFVAETPYDLMRKHLYEPISDVHAVRPGVPSAVTDVLRQALAKSPIERFPTVTAFSWAFETAITDVRGAPTGFFLAAAPPTPLTSPGLVLSEFGYDEGDSPIPQARAVGEMSDQVPWFRNRRVWGMGVLIALLLIAGVLLLSSGSIDGDQGDDAPAQAGLGTPTPYRTDVPYPLDTLLPNFSATPDLHATAQALAFEVLTQTATSWTDTPSPTHTLVPITAEPLTMTPNPPTATLIPPTETPTISPTGTRAETPLPPTATPTILPTVTLTGGGGARIAFVSDREDALPEIYVMGLSGGDVQRLTFDQAHIDSPDWSPDGTRMVYVSDVTGNAEIYVMSAAGGDPANLTNSPATDRWPDWSPDGTQIIFMSDRHGSTDIFVMNADGSGVRQLTTHESADRFPAWSADGMQIVFQSERDGNRELYAMNRDGSNIVRLTDEIGEDRFATWSPDGAMIIFQSDRDGDADIWAMNPSGGDLRNLTDNTTEDRYPAWSPDGMYIVFQSERDGNRELYVMDADGRNAVRLTDHAANDWKPAWQPALR